MQVSPQVPATLDEQGLVDQFLVYDGAVILVHRRRVHALLFTPHTATPAEWAHLLARLQTAIPGLRAQLTEPMGL